MRQLRWLGGFSMLLLPLLLGCKGQGEALARDPVNKVTGTILVDGKPEPMVAVKLIRVGDPDEKATSSKMLVPGGLTNAEGRFSVGTYEYGADADGAPAGDYKLTFHWGMINLMNGRYEGDKFNGKYADPEKSERTVTVAGAPVDLGTIELTTN